MNITLVHQNPARVHGGKLYVDRKFITGMTRYVQGLDAPIVSVHPALGENDRVMDLAEVPVDQLGYEVVTIDAPDGRVAASEQARIEDLVARSRLLVGNGYGLLVEARKQGVPYIMVLEYDLETRISVATLQARSRLRRLVRAIRTRMHHHRVYLPEVRAARAVHCNGYPVFDEVSPHNERCLLYLDSRMSRELVMTDEQLERRLATRAPRPLRMLYSGRYEPMKGALDAVRTAIACRAAGVEVELDCYGQGSQAESMRRAVADAGVGDHVRVHDAVTYQELTRMATSFDAFLCCHVQHDPSCTYLESLGAGLPIVGYGNRMWQRMCRESAAGVVTRLGDIDDNVRAIAAFVDRPERLADCSRAAIRFAAAHPFEAEFERRISAIRTEYELASR